MDLIPVADLGYQAQHADQNATVPLAVVNISVFAVTTVFVLLKLLSRRISKLKLELDDYTLILAWVRLRRSILHSSCYAMLISVRSFIWA